MEGLLGASRVAVTKTRENYNMKVLPASLQSPDMFRRGAEVCIYSNWRLGLFTQLCSANAMRKIYQVLREQQLRWRVVCPFQLMCRHAEELAGAQDVLCVQVYRMTDKPVDRGLLVDFTLLVAPFPIIDLLHCLYLKLRAVL
eukprot:NODE_6814_length_498_cov_8.948787_g6648_i0.p1 GENE.NODE_6814_length_498_cov_8.948787_g6648_i0~~NODE_6814_length_498_cov_8.948787_g6648_i0.p1  ORF type:complete len:142 (-),score=23.34 NODE_6814_length_498_cov_8.948787_g6648_i0:72-497(-)